MPVRSHRQAPRFISSSRASGSFGLRRLDAALKQEKRQRKSGLKRPHSERRPVGRRAEAVHPCPMRHALCNFSHVLWAMRLPTLLLGLPLTDSIELQRAVVKFFLFQGACFSPEAFETAASSPHAALPVGVYQVPPILNRDKSRFGFRVSVCKGCRNSPLSRPRLNFDG
jgi:hypothetical protein